MKLSLSPDVYEDTDRLDCLGLHPTHEWTYFGEGDCFDGIHAGMLCRNCLTDPFVQYVCHHDLPWTAAEVPEFLRRRKIRVDLTALQPCPRDAL